MSKFEEEMMGGGPGGIPVMRTAANVLSTGLNSDNLASSAVRLHPVERMQKASARNGGGRQLDLDLVRNVYGSGLAMRLATERQMASQVGGRLLGVNDSNAMLETLTGADTTLDFTDVLGRPSDNPVVIGVNGGLQDNPHAWMEHKLRM